MTGGIFKKPEIGKQIQPFPSPIPTSQDIDIQSQQRAEDVRRKLRSKKGRRGTILTESVLGVGDTEKKSLLGG